MQFTKLFLGTAFAASVLAVPAPIPENDVLSSAKSLAQEVDTPSLASLPNEVAEEVKRSVAGWDAPCCAAEKRGLTEAMSKLHLASRQVNSTSFPAYKASKMARQEAFNSTSVPVYKSSKMARQESFNSTSVPAYKASKMARQEAFNSTSVPAYKPSRLLTRQENMTVLAYQPVKRSGVVRRNGGAAAMPCCLAETRAVEEAKRTLDEAVKRHEAEN